MMLSKFKVITAAAVFTVFLGLLSGCPQPEEETAKSGNASAAQITVASIAILLINSQHK
jgi:hypothetical protein